MDLPKSIEEFNDNQFKKALSLFKKNNKQNIQVQ